MLSTESRARLASWDAWNQIPRSSYDRLEDHPDYTKAVYTFASRVLSHSKEDRALDGICKDVGRYVVAQWAVYLHLSGGLCLPRLKEVCARSGVLSPGRARALLLYLRYIGYIEPAPSTLRSIPAHYIPTARLMTAWSCLARIGLEAMAAVEPAAGDVLDCLDETAFLEAYLKHQGAGFLMAASALPKDNRFFRTFLHTNAGMHVLYWMIATAIDGGDRFPPVGSITFNIARVAHELCVSRTHIHRLLGAAQREHLLVRHADGSVGFTASLAADSRYILSTLLIGHVICAAKATQDRATDRSAAGDQPDRKIREPRR